MISRRTVRIFRVVSMIYLIFLPLRTSQGVAKIEHLHPLPGPLDPITLPSRLTRLPLSLPALMLVSHLLLLFLLQFLPLHPFSRRFLRLLLRLLLLRLLLHPFSRRFLCLLLHLLLRLLLLLLLCRLLLSL